MWLSISGNTASLLVHTWMARDGGARGSGAVAQWRGKWVANDCLVSGCPTMI
jgi:hypothetical protein